MMILKYSEFINESNREEYIKNYCKESPVIPQVPVSFKKIHGDLIKVGKYKETLKSIDNGDAVIVGIRRKLEARKNGQEKYIDSIYFIPKNAKKENPNITPFQATTVPSVAWFDTDVAILDDSEYKFKIGTHTFGSSNKTIPALVPSIDGLSPKEIPVNRFSAKDNVVKTYDPPKKDIGTGTNFHYGLPPKGVDGSSGIPCVGGYSAGCQVIPTEKKWNEFWNLVKNSKQQIFWYSIIEEDKL
jgi:hypothetical protein